MLVTVPESQTLVCPFRRNPDGTDAVCINVACMLWKFSNSRCPRTGLQLGRCGVALKEVGSWRLPIAKGCAARAPVCAPAPAREDSKVDSGSAAGQSKQARGHSPTTPATNAQLRPREEAAAGIAARSVPENRVHDGFGSVMMLRREPNADDKVQQQNHAPQEDEREQETEEQRYNNNIDII